MADTRKIALKRSLHSRILLLIAMLMFAAFPKLAFAQAVQSTCLAMANSPTAPVWKAAYQPINTQEETATITFVGHSTFRIRSPRGVVIATDFAGNYGRGRVPDIVTMNQAHETHYTFDIPDGVTHVLKGWKGQGEAAKHSVVMKDTYVRNVATDLHYGGDVTDLNGNSIFIFEMAGLCIGHVGHLHHELAPEHFAAIGRLDVLMVPVDGTYTMSQHGIIDLAKRLRASIVLPMHYFSFTTLNAFLDGMSTDFAIERSKERSIEVTLRNLPKSPVVVSLRQF